MKNLSTKKSQLTAPISFSNSDIAYMRIALRLARRGLGNVWPNPAVGCVIVKDRRVVGRGWTQPGGRPHAETEALLQAGGQAKGADIYVTLEPCSHHGQTPPCVDAIIAAGPARVIVATGDCDPRVSGTGLARLKAAGIAVTLGCLSEQAYEVNSGFFKRQQKGRPHVSLKCATTLDGKIATAGGKSQWITGPEARLRGHLMRARHDAILTGLGTLQADNPGLDCRLPGFSGRQPVRVLLDSNLRLSLKSQFVTGAARQESWVICLPGGDFDKQALLTAAGVKIIECQPDKNRRIDLVLALGLLADTGITRLMVEGGGGLSASFFDADCVDELYWFRAGRIMGGDGLPAIAELGIDNLHLMQRFVQTGRQILGADQLEIYRRTGLENNRD